MEPQILDFYNHFPQGVNIIDKMNQEYEELREKYEKLKSKEMPKVFYSSKKEFEDNIKKMFSKLKTELHKMIKYKKACAFLEGPWSPRLNGGVNIGPGNPAIWDFVELLKTILKTFTKNQDCQWSEKYVWKIIDILNIDVLTEKGFFQDIYNNSSKNEIWTSHQIADYIYKTVTFHLYREGEGILSEICVFKCVKCKRIGELEKNTTEGKERRFEEGEGSEEEWTHRRILSCRNGGREEEEVGRGIDRRSGGFHFGRFGGLHVDMPYHSCVFIESLNDRRHMMCSQSICRCWNDICCCGASFFVDRQNL